MNIEITWSGIFLILFFGVLNLGTCLLVGMIGGAFGAHKTMTMRKAKKKSRKIKARVAALARKANSAAPEGNPAT